MRSGAVVACLLGASLFTSVAGAQESQADFEGRKAAALKAALDQVAAQRAQSQKWAEEMAARAAAAQARSTAALIEAQAAHRAREAELDAHLQARKDAIAAATADHEQRLGDPRWAGPLFSAQLCGAQRDRATTAAELVKEKRLAKEVGAMDRQVMGEFLDALRDADQRAATARRQLAQMRLKPTACSNGRVTRIANCLADRSACDDETDAFYRLTLDPELL